MLPVAAPGDFFSPAPRADFFFRSVDCCCVFLPDCRRGLSQSELEVIREIDPEYIISNQQEHLDHFRERLSHAVNSKLLFLEELGAIEFRFERGVISPSYFADANDVRVPYAV